MSKNSIWKQEPDLSTLEMVHVNTMVAHLGIEITEIGPDYIKSKMPVDHRTIQPAGLLHGGASAVLSETMGSTAAFLCMEDISSSAPVGIEINANHLRSVKSGHVYGETKPIRVGKKIQVWNTDIFDEEKNLICTSRLTVMIVKR